jgi:hypothetical protein
MLQVSDGISGWIGRSASAPFEIRDFAPETVLSMHLHGYLSMLSRGDAT